MRMMFHANRGEGRRGEEREGDNATYLLAVPWTRLTAVGRGDKCCNFL